MFRLLDVVCVPEVSDLARWESLGVAAANILHTGSIKFDDDPVETTSSTKTPVASLERILRLASPDANAPVLLAGSTHPGEERIIAEVFLELRSRFPGLFFIIAPRHVERTAEIRAELVALGLRVSVRTSLTSLSASARPDMLLLDTTGELRDWYALATVVFIGKSFTGVGGQNPAEAIKAGAPVVFGPHMENFAELTGQLLAAEAAVQVEDSAGLKNACARLLSDPSERQRLVEAASRQIAIHRGAGARTAALLLAEKRNSTCQNT